MNHVGQFAVFLIFFLIGLPFAVIGFAVSFIVEAFTAGWRLFDEVWDWVLDQDSIPEISERIEQALDCYAEPLDRETDLPEYMRD